jgi:hypothetical protein
VKFLVRLRPWTLLVAVAIAVGGVGRPTWVAAYGGTDPPTAPTQTPPNAGGAVLLIETVFDDATPLESLIQVMAAMDLLVR